MSDPRAYASEKIAAPHPLPFVSRKALRRVKDWMPPPEDCRFCGAPVELVSNAEIYGREYGDWPYAYKCCGCDSYVGLHPQTDLPLGTLADKVTREARKSHKAAFVGLQKTRGWTRRESYAWLALALRMNPEECHWGMFSVEQAEAAGAACRKEMSRRAEA